MGMRVRKKVGWRLLDHHLLLWPVDKLTILTS